MRFIFGCALACTIVSGSFFTTLALIASPSLSVEVIPLPRHKPLQLRAEQVLATLLERQVVNRSAKSDQFPLAETCDCRDEPPVLALR
jgi:hypothetical protein